VFRNLNERRSGDHEVSELNGKVFIYLQGLFDDTNARDGQYVNGVKMILSKAIKNQSLTLTLADEKKMLSCQFMAGEVR